QREELQLPLRRERRFRLVEKVERGIPSREPALDEREIALAVAELKQLPCGVPSGRHAVDEACEIEEGLAAKKNAGTFGSQERRSAAARLEASPSPTSKASSREPPRGESPHCSAMASISVDLPVPLSPARKVTEESKASSSGRTA